jgi:type II secretory pathway pseudopilin PulG
MTRPSCRRCQAGMTVIELTVALLLMASVVAVLGPMMTATMNSGRRVQAQSENLDELRVAMASIGRELRSADCISSPSIPVGADNGSGDRLLFRTQANNTLYWVEYVVTAAGELTREVNGSGQVKVVAIGLQDASTTFRHWSTPRRSVELTFHVRLDPEQGARTLTSTIAGRNAWRAC